MNKELLFQLYAIHSPSGREKKMCKFVKRYIRRNCGWCNIEQDGFGNVFVTKGNADSYPCIAAHLDQVQDGHSKDFEVVEGRDVVFGYSHKSREQQGLGADDKNGIWIALECLREYSDLKVAFFVGEEVGCQGSSRCDLSFFSDCKYIIQPDRMHGSDLITSMWCGDVCSEQFIEAITPYAVKHGYKENEGSVTDVGELVERGVGISCLNLSCGYYNPHHDDEFTVLSELDNCLHLVCEIIDNLTEKAYPHEYIGYNRYGYGGYSYRKYGGGYATRGYLGGTYHKSPVAKPVTKFTDDNHSLALDYEEDTEYYDSYYEDDFEMMQRIMLNNKQLTFEELVGVGGWIGNFITRSESILRELYDDVCQLEGLGEYAEKAYSHESEFWDTGDDDDDLTFDDIRLRNVS